MAAETKWVWNRPLDPGAPEDRAVWVSRGEDVQRVLALLESHRTVFVWSPPKSGTTTFFHELQLHGRGPGNFDLRILDAREVAKDLAWISHQYSCVGLGRFLAHNQLVTPMGRLRA